MSREQQLEAMLQKIVNRALRPEQMPSTHHMVQKVPAGLIDEARALLVPPTEADLPAPKYTMTQSNEAYQALLTLALGSAGFYK